MDDYDAPLAPSRLDAPTPSKAEQLRQNPLTSSQKNKLPKVIQKALGSHNWCLIAKEHQEVFRYDETALRFEEKSSQAEKVKRFSTGGAKRWLLVLAKTDSANATVSAPATAMQERSAYAAEQYLTERKLTEQQPTPEQIIAASQVFGEKTDGANAPSVCFTQPSNNRTITVDADPAQWRSPITYNERSVLVKAGESATTLAQTHYGRPDAQLIYKINPSFSPSRPPKAGESIIIRDGAAIEFGLSTRNLSQVTVTAKGAVSQTLNVDILNEGPEYIETRASLPAKTGTYELTANAEGASHSQTFHVEVIPAPTDWLKVTAKYDDTWQTPLPLSNMTVQVNGINHSTKLALNEGTGSAQDVDSDWMADRTRHDPGALVVDELPKGDVSILIEDESDLESSITNETDSLIRALDGAYRSLVSDMSTFQKRWDDYGYAAIALDGGNGLLTGGTGWVKDQAELFEAETWQALGTTLSSAATRTMDVTADYATNVYGKLKDTAQY